MSGSLTRRELLGLAAGLAMAGSAEASARRTTAEQIAACEAFTGSNFTPAEREQMLALVDEQLERLRLLRSIRLENDLPPASLFDPRLPGFAMPAPGEPAPTPAPPPPVAPADAVHVPARVQAAWLREGALDSVALTRACLARIDAIDPGIHAFVEVTRELALEQAARADAARRDGRLLGPLHGLPYGLKDLIDTAGIATTWGAGPYRGRVPPEDAVVVRRLADAGAVLLGKTAPGALAYGDLWFRERTRNPWNPQEGSSGSSAGSAAAVAAGLCAFAIGTETMGSIVSPANRCGVTGLRPSFGRVARTGTMSLCWSLDKIGVLARCPADALLVLAAINGADGGDPASLDLPLHAEPAIDPKSLRLGFRPEWFEGGPPTDREFLAAAQRAGFRLTEILMPATPVDALGALLVTEAAAAFEPLTLDGTDDALRWQDDEAWPNQWRAARFHTAIAYVQAQRLRRRLMREFTATMAGVDALIHPNDAGSLLQVGNYTGCPTLTIPAGFVQQPTREGFKHFVDPAGVAAERLRRVPFTASLTGRLFDEARLVAIGRAIARELPPMPRFSAGT